MYIVHVSTGGTLNPYISPMVRLQKNCVEKNSQIIPYKISESMYSIHCIPISPRLKYQYLSSCLFFPLLLPSPSAGGISKG